jgi:hypothetical protein
MPTQTFNPPISNLVEIDNLPDELGFVKDGLSNLLSKIYYRDLQFSKNAKGDAAFYSLQIVSLQRIDIEIPGTGIFLILNPTHDPDTTMTSNFPIILSYEWGILAYLRDFNLSNFSFKGGDFFELSCQILGITEAQLINKSLSFFGISINTFVDDVNSFYGTTIPYPSSAYPINELVASINAEPSLEDSSVIIFTVYLLDAVSDENTIEKINGFFSSFFGPSTVDFIKKLVKPKINASLELGVGLEFPRNVLVPLQSIGGPPVTDEDVKSTIIFDGANFSYSTETGIGYDLDIAANLSHPSRIGNTGFEIDFTGAKLDISRTTNIPEATADGRPDDFVGVFIKDATIKLPPLFNQNHNSGSNAVIKGRNLLIGTGGLSGSLGIEADSPTDPNPAIVSAKFGSGFEAELNSCNVLFHQNSIVESNIQGTLKIPGFKDSAGNQAEINIKIHIENDGDFSITAREDQGINAISIPDIFDFRIDSLTIGRQDTKFFMALSGKIDFKPQGNLGQFLPQDIEIKRIIIYDDGTFEFEGGAITFPRAYSFELGPAKISITAIHMGSHEQEHGGSIRKYKYFGFDGGVSINPGGIDARGDGIKFFYTIDNDLHGGQSSRHWFIRIQSLKIDILLPGDATEDTATFILKGWLAMKAPSPPADPSSTEYAGGIEFRAPNKLKGLEGAASMRYNPSIPSFIVDAEIDFAKAIPLGSTGLGIYGFRGLFGRRYVATKPAAGVPEDGEWWQYYKKKLATEYKEGIVVEKFEPKDGLSLGAGVSLATTADNGKTFSSKLFFMLSMPDVFLFQGQAAIMKERITLTSPDPPFFAIIAITSQSVEAGFGLDFKLREDGDPGKLVTVQGIIEMGFFWGNSTAWYVNIGRDTPADRRIQARVGDIFNMYFYMMMSNSGIRAGAGATFGDEKKFGPLKAILTAYIDLAGRISFKPKQVGGSINLGGSVGLYIFKFGFTLSVNAGLAAEASKPRIFTGTFEVCIKVLKKEYCAKFDLTWNYDNSLDFSPVPIIDANALNETAKTINQLTNETLNLFTSVGASIPEPASWAGGAESYIVPLDSFIDIEFKKPLHVTGSHSSLSKFGGVTTGATYTDYIAPQKGKSDRVQHQYFANKIEILYYSKDDGTAGGTWKTFDLYKSLTPQQDAAFVDQTVLQNLKLGYWMMEQPSKYNKLRVLAQDPLSYYNGGYTIEDLGVTDETIFCGGDTIPKTCVDFKGIRRVPVLIPADTLIKYQNFLYQVIGADGAIVAHPYTTFNNAFSLTDGAQLEIYFDEPVACIDIVMQIVAPNVRVDFYKRVTIDPVTVYELPTFEYVLVDSRILTSVQLNVPVHYESAIDPIDKIVITSGVCEVHEDHPFVCDATITQQASDLENFLSVMAQNGHLMRNNVIYPDLDRIYAGVFHGTSLYRRTLNKGSFIQTRLITFTEIGPILEFEIFDNLDFRCVVKLEAPENIPWTGIIRFFNLRPDPDLLIVGTNFNFLVDVEFKGGAIMTLKGRSCYPVINCYDECSTFIYEFCSLSLQNYLFNQTVPSSAQVTSEANQMIDALTKTLQPVWRPNTHYAIRIEVKDERLKENTANSSTVETFVFGFKTAGPVGHYHIYPTGPNDNEKLTDFEEKEDDDREAEFQLSTLNPYIDYPKCFPNADGQLINAKPLYYKNPKLLVFYNKPYVYQFYNNWDVYPFDAVTPDLEAINSSIEVNIKDPADQNLQTPSTTTWKNIQPLTSQIQDVFDALPLGNDVVALNNMLTNGNPCVTANTPLLPLVPYNEITFPDLKPLKLYTAIMNAKYQRMNTDTQPHVREAHKYPFETSRYGNFEEHIKSYILKTQVIASVEIIVKAAIYTIPQAFDSTAQINIASQFVTNPDSVADNLIQEYGHPFDRLIDGILKIRSDKMSGQSLEPAVTNEFNFIKNTNTGNVLGVLVRSPEPYNDPKLPASILSQTITAQWTDGILVDPGYKVFFSKDNAKAFITKDDASLNIPLSGTLKITFSFMLWDGFQYSNVGTPVDVEIDLSNL